MKRPLIILTGPTAVGKSALSIQLAKAIGGEIISADSMQVYRKMDIGSAKITKEEMEGIPHHLIDILDPDEEFNVFIFQKKAKEALETIYQNGKIPIVVGGTGFYIQALLYDIKFEEEENSEVRRKLEEELLEKGAHALHERLALVDPVSAEEIHENNSKRVIRALEFYELTGEMISKHNEEQRQREAAYQSCYFVLTDDRQKIYERIDKRVDVMMDMGLLEEVRALKEQGMKRGMVSMQGLGYKEILDYLDGICTLEDAIETIKKESRHFAKRQLTWFRRERDVIWLDKKEYPSEEQLLQMILKELVQKGIRNE